MLKQPSETPIPAGFEQSVKQSIKEEVDKADSNVEKGRNFLHWVVTRIFDATEEEIENQITDGKDDMGIDAWLKPDMEGDEEEGIIQLFQLKYGKSHDEMEILRFKEDVKNFLKMKVEDIPRDDMKRLQQRIKHENLLPELYYITDQKIISKKIPKLKVFGIDQIVETLWNEITGLPKGKIEKITLENMFSYNNTVVGVMSLSELRKFIEKTKSYIYESNIRKFLRKTKVNKGLKETLELDSKNVFYFNNGITLVVKQMKINGKEIVLDEPQIVNGAQTSSTIYENLPLITNVIGDITVTIITETNKTTREDITRFRNSQNAVKGKDLISLKNYHTSIRGQLEQFRYYYEQQAGGWLSMDKPKRNEYSGHDDYNRYLQENHSHKIPAKDAIQAMVAGIYQNPTKPYTSIASFMPSGKYYEEIFNAKLKEDYRLLLYPYLVKCYSEQLGYGDKNAQPEQRRYARLLFVTAYFKILFDYILRKDPDEIKKDPKLIEMVFKNFETNKKLLDFTNEAVEYYFHHAKTYLKKHQIPTWHNFFSKYAWDDDLITDLKSFVTDYPDKLKEIRQNIRS